MIMRITWGKVQPGMWPEYADAYRQTMEPISSGIQGLRGRWLAHDLDEADAGFAVSIWDSQADLDAYRSSELFEQQARPRSATTSSTSSAPTTARSTSSKTSGSPDAGAAHAPRQFRPQHATCRRSG